jgi:hypothetical protein
VAVLAVVEVATVEVEVAGLEVAELELVTDALIGSDRPGRRSSRSQPRGGVSAAACRMQSSPARAFPSSGVSSQTVRASASNVNVATADALQPKRAHCRFVLLDARRSLMC